MKSGNEIEFANFKEESYKKEHKIAFRNLEKWYQIPIIIEIILPSARLYSPGTKSKILTKNFFENPKVST